MPGYTIFPSITPSDADEHVETPTAEELADSDYQAATNAVRAGEIDDQLEALAELDERKTVQRAIRDRCDELGRAEAMPEGELDRQEPDQQAAADD